MHEFSASKQIVDGVLEEAEKHNAKKVLEVHLIIGKFTFLNVEQIKFWYEALTKDTIMEKSTLHIEQEDIAVQCDNCGYEGQIKLEEKDVEHHHYITPTLSCPRCGSPVYIIKGKECTVKTIKFAV